MRENTSIAFVVDPSLRVLLWSNGLVEATNLTQGTVEGRDVSCLPFLSADNRDNTTAAIQQLFREKEGGAKRRMVVALVPGANAAAATREILLQFTAAFYEDQQHVVCVGLKLEGALSSLLHQYAASASETISSLTSGTNSGLVQPELRDDTETETVSSLTSGTYLGMTTARSVGDSPDSDPEADSEPESYADSDSVTMVPCANAGSPMSSSDRATEFVSSYEIVSDTSTQMPPLDEPRAEVELIASEHVRGEEDGRLNGAHRTV